MPEAIATVDETVALPPSVRRAAEAANAAHKAVYGDAPITENAPQPQPEPTPATEPAPQPQPEPTPAPEPAPQPQPEPPVEQVGTAEQEHHRYLSMKGRYEQATTTLGSMQEQMQELGNELVRTQALLNQPRQRQQQPQPRPQPLLTEADIQNYGPELIDVVKRAAREAVLPDLQNVAQQTRQVSQRVESQTRQGVFHDIAAEVPNWEQINVNPRFKQWCGLRDIYSGEVRGKMLNAAIQAADAPRAIAFFMGFLAEEVATGNEPAPQPEPSQTPRQAAVPLETLTAPGRARPATGDTQVPVDKPVFTRGQIAKFYSDVRKGVYAGRDTDKQRDEALIFAAQRDGRVRG